LSWLNFHCRSTRTAYYKALDSKGKPLPKYEKRVIGDEMFSTLHGSVLVLIQFHFHVGWCCIQPTAFTSCNLLADSTYNSWQCASSSSILIPLSENFQSIDVTCTAYYWYVLTICWIVSTLNYCLLNSNKHILYSFSNFSFLWIIPNLLCWLIQPFMFKVWTYWSLRFKFDL
jgi:hypothetical protein